MAQLQIDPDKLEVGDMILVEGFVVGFTEDPSTFSPEAIIDFGTIKPANVKYTRIREILK